MLYADILLEVVFNTKNTGHHVIPLYARHIIGGGVQHLNTTSNNVSGITYNMVTSFIGVEHHFQQYVSYNV
jgi:hypothetical protein